MVIQNQVSNARRLGVKELTVTAAGAKGDTFNGYTTWAKLGFNGAIGRPLPARFKGAKDLNDLHRMKGGAEWWKENGSTFNGTFDLGRGSKQVKFLNDYFTEREARPVGQGRVVRTQRIKGDRSTTRERAAARAARRVRRI